MNSVLRFWLDRGVDGFRIDAATHLLEDELLRDEPTPAGGGKVTWSDRTYTDGRAENHRVVSEFRRVLDAYDDRLLFGELTVSVDRLMTYHGAGQFHFPLNNQIMHTEPWEASRVAAAIDQYQMLLPPGEWQTWNLASHDVSRIATRAGQAQARIAVMLLMTLPGTPIIYNGDEIGLEDVEVAVDQLRDPQAPFGSGRDNYRGAMAWNNEDGAGFTTGTPWLPLPPDFRVRNVATMQTQPTSILHLYRCLLALRSASATLWTGEMRQHHSGNDISAFWRQDKDERYFVVLNFVSVPHDLPWLHRGTVVLSTALEEGMEVEGHLRLKGNEGLIVRLSNLM